MQTQQKYVKVAAKEGTLILIFIAGQSFNEFLGQLTDKSADIMASLCGVHGCRQFLLQNYKIQRHSVFLKDS